MNAFHCVWVRARVYHLGCVFCIHIHNRIAEIYTFNTIKIVKTIGSFFFEFCGILSVPFVLLWHIYIFGYYSLLSDCFLLSWNDRYVSFLSHRPFSPNLMDIRLGHCHCHCWMFIMAIFLLLHDFHFSEIVNSQAWTRRKLLFSAFYAISVHRFVLKKFVCTSLIVWCVGVL